MSDYFLFCQKCENHCNFYQHFKIPLANCNNSGKCVFDEAQKRGYSFYCPLCRMITFMEFETTTNESAIGFLKR